MLRRIFTGEVFTGKTWFERILIGTWLFVLGSVALLGIVPRIAARIPYPAAIRTFLLIFALVSVAYCVVFLYRQGMKRAKSDGSDGTSHRYDAPR